MAFDNHPCTAQVEEIKVNSRFFMVKNDYLRISEEILHLWQKKGQTDKAELQGN